MYFDHHGKQIKFPFKIDSKNIENYPMRILQNKEFVVKKPEITNKEAIDKLCSELNRPVEGEIRDLNEKVTVNEVSEIYIPIYEARLVGPKRRW